MTLDVWGTFFIGVILICGSPGPNMLQVMASSAKHGFTRSVYTMAGCFVAVFILIGVSVAGVGVLIEAFPAGFDALRYAGAAYLMYLGIRTWRAPIVRGDKENTPIVAYTSSGELFYNGFWVGINNPKAMLFASAFFPQFINPHVSQTVQLAILLATFGVVEFSWYLLYAMGGSRLTKALQTASVQKRFNRITGSLFVVFGVAMVARAR